MHHAGSGIDHARQPDPHPQHLLDGDAGLDNGPPHSIAHGDDYVLGSATGQRHVKVVLLADLQVSHGADQSIFHQLQADCVPGSGIKPEQDLRPSSGGFPFPHLDNPAIFQQLAHNLRDRADTQTADLRQTGAGKRAMTPNRVEDKVAIHGLDQIAIAAPDVAHRTFLIH